LAKCDIIRAHNADETEEAEFIADTKKLKAQVKRIDEAASPAGYPRPASYIQEHLRLVMKGSVAKFDWR
jgi:hypothetical protein